MHVYLVLLCCPFLPVIISSEDAYIYNLKLLEDFCKSLWNALPAHLSSTWNDISLMQGMIYWKLEAPCGPIAFWYEDISHEHELAVHWLQRYVSCISQHLNQHNDDLNIIRFFLGCVPNLVARFLCVSWRSYVSAELGESVEGYPSLLLIMGMYLPLPFCLHSSLLHRCEWCFYGWASWWRIHLLWLTFPQDQGSSVASIITEEPTYCSGGTLLLSWSLCLRQCALVHINYAGSRNYIFMYSDNYIFNTADVCLI